MLSLCEAGLALPPIRAGLLDPVAFVSVMVDIVFPFRKMSTKSDLCRVRDYAELIQGPRLKCP